MRKLSKNICDVHGSCGEDYKKESSESEAASEEENQIPIIKDNHISPIWRHRKIMILK